MMNRILGVLGVSSLLLSGIYAFEDTSPFILAVSHKYAPLIPTLTHDPPRTPSLHALNDVQSSLTISSQHFQALARQTISQCSSGLYFLIDQPGLHVTDFNANTIPYLRKIVMNAESKITADYGHGQVDLQDISLLAQDKCGAEPTFVDARRNHEFIYVINCA